MKKEFLDKYKDIPVINVEFTVTKDTWTERQKLKEEREVTKIQSNVKTTALPSKFKEIKGKFKEQQEYNQRVSKLYQDWISVMANKDIHNKLNQTFTIKHIEEKEYGWSFRIYSPKGQKLEELETCKPYIESGIHCLFLYKIPEHKQFAMGKIIYPNKVKCNDIPFKPFKVKPYELALGVDVSGEPIILNVNKQAQALIGGQTRSGKNACADIALTSLIWSCSEKEIELYLFQCAKNDLVKYRSCKQVKAFVMGDLEEMIEKLEEVYVEMKRREQLLLPMTESLKGDNLFDYNKQNPTNQLSYIYVVFDEFIEVMPSETDDKSIKKYKSKILNYLQSIAQWGGSYAINYIILHQKPEAKLCPTFLKNQSNIRVSFSFTDPVCSEIVLGNRMACGLQPRRAIFINEDRDFDMLYTTNLRYPDGSSRIEEFIKDSKIKKVNMKKENKQETPKESHKGLVQEGKATGKVKLEDVKKDEEMVANPIEQLKQTELVQQNFSKVDPTAIQENQDKLKKNIGKIPNFVPYNPNPNPKVKVIDETNIAFMKSEKPIKQGKVKLNEIIPDKEG